MEMLEGQRGKEYCTGSLEPGGAFVSECRNSNQKETSDFISTVLKFCPPNDNWAYIGL